MPEKKEIPETSLYPIPLGTSGAHITEVKPSFSPIITETQLQISPQLTITRVNIVTPTPIPAYTATINNTLIPTLAPVAAKQQLESLIKNPNDCPLPCWFGLTPGMSNYKAFLDVVAPFASILIFYGEAEGISFELGQENFISFYIDIYKQANQNLIEAIYVSTQALTKDGDGYLRDYGSTAYDELLEEYSLNRILEIYGVPSEILLKVQYYLYDGRRPLPDQQFGTLTARIIYSERGIFITYEMPLKKIADYGRGCPSESFLNLWLTPPDHNGHYLRILSKRQKEGEAFDFDKTLESTTHLSLETFTERFQSSERSCINVSLGFWPEP